MMTNLTPKSNQADASGGRAALSTDARPLILVIEDHEDTRLMLRMWLEMHGYKVVEAEDGEGGIKQAEIRTPDLILMDRSLPQLDGLSVLRRIREHANLCHIPVIVLSGHAHPADSQAAFDAGCDDYLVKPINFIKWERILARHLPQIRLDGDESPIRGLSE